MLRERPALRETSRAHSCSGRRLLLLLLIGAMAGAASDPLPAAPAEVYRYRVHGKVRLLFLWLGRDDVGGGSIALSSDRGQQSDSWSEQVEILFGSDPNRVPGRINRWGYGMETAEWRQGDGKPEPELWSTVFEGFMRHSSEQSLAEVRANESTDKNTRLFWYDGIHSRVSRGESVSEVRTFSTDKDFDYRDSTPIHCSYRARLGAGPPNRVRRLEGPSAGYTEPWGFLTAIRSFVSRAVRQPEAAQQWAAGRPSIDYVYNAKTLRLTLKRLRIEDRFELPVKDVKTGKTAARQFRQVARMDLNILDAKNDYDHDFAIWVPLAGDYRGIPVRVEDRPRWWLKLVLDLVPGGEDLARQERAAAAARGCN